MQKHDGIPSLLITEQAARVIRHESLTCPVETGGTLFGYPNGCVIERASGPGSKARKQACLFSADVEYQRKIANEFARQTGGKRKLMGYWHKHPGDMGWPSSGDQTQAEQIAASSSTNSDACGLVFLITTVTTIPKRVKAHAYRFNMQTKALERVGARLVSDEAPLVIKAREQEPISLFTRKAELFNELNFRFQDTLFGRERLDNEVSALRKAGILVQVGKRKRGDRIVLTLKGSTERKLLVIPPIEFPLNPPRIFELPEGRELRTFESPGATTWNSDRRIVDIVRTWFEPCNDAALLP